MRRIGIGYEIVSPRLEVALRSSGCCHFLKHVPNFFSSDLSSTALAFMLREKSSPFVIYSDNEGLDDGQGRRAQQELSVRR